MKKYNKILEGSSISDLIFEWFEISNYKIIDKNIFQKFSKNIEKDFYSVTDKKELV